jgi:hypothetical protein
MPARCITYRGRYRYQLREEHVDEVRVTPDRGLSTEYLTLGTDGLLTIRQGYAWDGPSGPAPDWSCLMRGSLVHDALYQLMRDTDLDPDVWRDVADRDLQRMSREDGAWRIVAWIVYHALRWGGDPAARPESRRPELRAPHSCPEIAPEAAAED